MAKNFLAGKPRLEFGQARLNSKVLCVSVPDMRIWDIHFPYQYFYRPIPGKVYLIRGSVVFTFDPKTQVKGVLLFGIQNPNVIYDQMSGEPSFPCGSFILMSS